MLGLLRLMSGRRLLIAAILVVLVLSGSTALRAGAAWLRTHRDAGQDPPRGVPPTQQP
jgi:hypothetical protein